MTRSLAALIGVATLLTALIAWESIGDDTAGPPPRRTADAHLTPGTTAAASPDDAVTTILDRPLFNPGRRPIATAQGAAGVPRLAGVIVTPQERVAIFAPAGDAHALAVHEGGQVGAGRVMRIGNGEVVVEGPQGRHILHPALTPPAIAR